jgi:hypothetical protein
MQNVSSLTPERRWPINGSGERSIVSTREHNVVELLQADDAAPETSDQWDTFWRASNEHGYDAEIVHESNAVLILRIKSTLGMTSWTNQGKEGIEKAE